MCGIAGLISRDGRPVDQGRLVGMVGRIAHRGPDGEGVWAEGVVGLGHRRLAIVDLGDGGKQPMLSGDGRFAITFNGEIYNYQELKKELESDGVEFRSTSDTEVLLELFARHSGRMLARIRGMFAFAIWDKQKNELFFARDRIGKKPFFYRDDAQGFAFASELKALVDEKTGIDPQAIRLFLGLQYVPSPLTGFKGIASLEPGMCGTWRNGVLQTRSYLEARENHDVSFSDAVAQTRKLLEESVRLRLIADVPVGIFLSGGIDSSAVAAVAHAQGAKLASFTLGFDEAAFDERDQAASLATKFGFEHHAFLAKPEDLLAIADEVIQHYDAPYADSSALNTWLLARETRSHVKAVLTGDGGDELFGGYRRYRYLERARRLPRFLAGPIHFAGDALGRSDIRRFATTVRDGYPALFCGSYFQKPEAMAFIRERLNDDSVASAMAFDLHSYLPDDLNVKMDRATMRHGLEARCPLLDQELVSYVTGLPAPYRFSAKRLKPLLVEAVKDILPADVGQRPKRGFQVPLAVWFRGPLRSVFVERCVQNATLNEYVNSVEIEKYLHEHDAGTDHGNRLWMLLSLATWLERYV